jgi:hypothetical protein
MQIVIDIDDNLYTRLFDNGAEYLADMRRACVAIRKGKPLPKEHGRLGDLDTLYEDVTNGIKAGNYEEGYEEYENINDMGDIVDAIKYAPTVIEADKEVDK